MNNPCEKHLNVRASDGYCPICLLDEIAQLRASLDEMREALVNAQSYIWGTCPDTLRADARNHYSIANELLKKIEAVLTKYPGR